jgi:hypothetical protein
MGLFRPQLREQFMKRYILACLTVAVVFGCSLASVKADDIYQPPWLRGQPRTTFQEWTFATANNPIPAEGLYNPYGIPTAVITGGSWQLFYDNHVGVWTLGASDRMDFGIPNAPYDPERWKDVWIQVTWQPDLGAQPIVAVDGNAATWLLTAPVGNGGWFQSVYEYVFPNYNPDFEFVSISGTIDVGQVVIDTICVPEPSSLGLLAMGALGLLYASRKRR